MRIKMGQLICLFPILMLSSVADADYITELELRLQNTNTDYQENIEEKADEILVDATVYFSPVTTENVPLVEAGFLSRQSSMGISYVDTDTDTDFKYEEPFAQRNVSESSKGKYLSGRFVVTESDLILGVEIGQVDKNYETTGTLYDSTTDIIGLSIGWYLTDVSALTFRLGEAQAKTEYRYLFLDYSENTEEETDSISVDYKHVFSLYGGRYVSINSGILLLEVSGDWFDSYKGILESASVDWYLHQRFSIGCDLKYANYDFDNTSYSDVKDIFYSVNTRYYFNEKVGLSASLGRNRASDDDGTIYDSDRFFIGLHINI